VFQHALNPCPPDLRPPAGDGPAGRDATPAPTAEAAAPDVQPQAAPRGHADGVGSLVPALRLAADLAGRLAAAAPDARVTVSVSFRHVEHCPGAEFLAHGDDSRRLAALTAGSRIFDIPLTVSDSPSDSDGTRVWLGGSALRDGVWLRLHSSFTDPAAVADVRRDFPTGTGGW
jgi:hypothetical protein